MGQSIIFRTGICEDINIGPRQGDLQSNLDGTDAHLRTVPTSLRKRGISSANGFHIHACRRVCESKYQENMLLMVCSLKYDVIHI